MKNIKKFAFEKPIIFSIVLIFITVLLIEIPLEKYFKIFSNNQYNSYLTGIFEQGFVSFLLLILLIKFDIFKYSGFTNIKNSKDLWIGWPLIILTIMNGWSVFNGSTIIDISKPVLIILYAITYLSTGLFEEILCRGVILIVMLHKWGNSKKGIYISVITSSILFGVTHFINFAQGRSTLIATFTQMIFGFFAGVFFAACFLRNKSIWPMIILHAAFDICGSFQEIAIGGGFREGIYTVTLGDALGSIVVTLPLIIYGLYILRKVKPYSIQSNFKTIMYKENMFNQ